jgi:hypothetical protein
VAELQVVWVTSAAADGVDHAVTDEDMAAGLGLGQFVGVCGSSVVPAAMVAPPLPRCQRCVVFLRAWATLREFATPTPTRRRRRRLCLGVRRRRG